MISTFLFDHSNPKIAKHGINIWYVGALLLAAGFLLFGLVLMGVRGLSNGGIAFAALSTLWVLVGLTTRTISFPPILFLPLVFFLFLVVTGFQMDPYPTEYILRMITIWLGAISLAVFIANGLSINVVLFGLFIVCVANFIAIYVGYDGAMINKQDFDMDSLELVEVKRYSGLAGQQNLLLSLMFTFPFLFFALRTRFNIVVFIVLALIGIAITFLTGSRSGIVFSVLFIAFGALLLVERSPIQFFVVILGFVLSIVAVTFLTNDKAIGEIENSILGEQILVQRVINKLDGIDTSAEAREQFQTEFWPTFDKKPLIGHGPGAYKDATGFGVYAHNNFAEIAVNGGVVGLLLYYLMYLFVGFGVLNSLQRNIALAAPLVFLIFADSWYVTFVSRPFMLLLCILLVVSFPLQKAKRKRRKHRKSRS